MGPRLRREFQKPMKQFLDKLRPIATTRGCARREMQTRGSVGKVRKGGVGVRGVIGGEMEGGHQ